MKLFFIFSLFTTSAFACPNFSGEYFNEQFGTYYSISQDDCSVVNYIYDEGTISFPIDGSEYITSDYDIVVEEGKVLAHVTTFAKKQFKAKSLITFERSVTKFTRDGQEEVETAREEAYLNKATDLVKVSHSKSGKEISIDKRVSRHN
jgi:hypothetical protein